jgi:hypothetical protein
MFLMPCLFLGMGVAILATGAVVASSIVGVIGWVALATAWWVGCLSVFHSQAHLFADHLEFRNGFGTIRTVQVDEIIWVEQDHHSEGTLLKIQTRDRTETLYASQFSPTQRDRFELALTRAMWSRQPGAAGEQLGEPE